MRLKKNKENSECSEYSTKEECDDRMWEQFEKEDISRKELMEIRDRISNVKDLVSVLCCALRDGEQINLKSLVGDVLHFHVLEQIKIIDQEINKIYDKY